MPRITAERREARRAGIVAAARRCFSRDGFHRTSMPDIAAEAGLSVGAPYRYFSGKEDLLLEVAGQAFWTMFGRIGDLLEEGGPSTVAELFATAVEPVSGETVRDAAGGPVSVDELLRCGVQSWAELLRNEGLRQRAAAGFNEFREQIADALRRGQDAGTVSTGLDPDGAARALMALLHGFILQRTAFDLEDVDGFVQAVRALLDQA